MLRAFMRICSQPWAMTPEYLQLMIDISRREQIAVGDIQALRREMGRPLDNAHAGSFIRGNVGVVPVYGPIFSKSDAFTEISGATSVAAIARDLTALAGDQSVESVLFDLDTPGGEVAGISELADFIHNYPKPTKSYVSAMAASAGYWIAAATGEIVTEKTSTLGSIGVVMGVRKKDPNDKVVEFVSSNARMKRPDPQSESGQETIQTYVDALASIFEESVMEFRDKVTPGVLSSLNGRVVTGRDAIAMGLADRIGSLEGLVSEMSILSISRNQQYGGSMKFKTDTRVGRQLQGIAKVLGLEVETEEPDHAEEDANAFLANAAAAQEVQAKLAEVERQLYRQRVTGIFDSMKIKNVGTPALRLSLEALAEEMPETDESIRLIEAMSKEIALVANIDLLVHETVPGNVPLPADAAKAKDDFSDDPTIKMIKKDQSRSKNNARA